MITDWFSPMGHGDADTSDLIEESHRQDGQADALLLGRLTFEDFRGYWPQQTGDTTGITNYLNSIQKFVVSTTLTDPQWSNSTVLSGDPVREVAALKEQPGRDIVLTGSISLAHTPHHRRPRRRVPPLRLPGRAGPRTPALPGRLRGPAAAAHGLSGLRQRHHPAALRHPLTD